MKVDWKPCNIFGALGRVAGMQNWPRSATLEWLALSSRADEALRMKDGKAKEKHMAKIADIRHGILIKVEAFFNGKDSGKSGGAENQEAKAD